MVRLVCSECGRVWYTANTKRGQTCDECGKELMENNNKNEIKNENKKRN